MEYEELAEKFCRLNYLQGTRIQMAEKPLSAPGERAVLLCIYKMHEKNKKALPGELTRELGVSFSRMTNILNALEKKGYIHRQHDSVDRRRVYVSLTPVGETYIQSKYWEGVENFRRLFQQLGRRDAEEYYRISARIHEICEEWEDKKRRER